MRVCIGGKDIAFLQIALNVISLDPLADDFSAFLHQTGNEIGGIHTIAFADRLQTGVEAIDELAAVPPRCPPTNAGRFDDCDLVAFFDQMQTRRQAAVACADDQDIDREITFERRDRTQTGTAACL